MSPLPTGTVTFLFTDIEGSTSRWEHDRASMTAALARHNAILDRAIAAHGGHVFHTAGDAYCAAFAQAGDAVAAAIDAQRALHLERWDEIPTTTGAGPAPGFEPLRVRMGLHTGLVELKDGDYFGRPVNRVARLMAAGHGGQVLVSLATQQLVRDALPKGCELIDLGVHRLKDLEHTEHLFRLVAPGFPDVATPPDSAEQLPDRGGPGGSSGTAAALDPDTLPTECPYRGLFAFRPEDAPFFFGREAFTELLVEAVQTTRLVGVIGPSGSGKSSVVFAGLVPRLQGDGAAWTVLDFRPGPQPFHALAAMLVPLLERSMSETDRLIEVEKLAGALSSGTLSLAKVLARLQQQAGDSGRILLVADQFEELYTLCPDVDERHRFLDCLFEGLMDPATRGVPQMTLVLTLRADFMGHALAYRPFADALQHHNIVLGPMTREELTAAIVRPAEKQGRQFESGLPERLLADLGEHPGNLPLLEFALTQLWEHQQNGWLTHEAYDTIGHVEGALARYADEVYGRLPAADQATAERIFLQLVRPGEGTEDTRRLATHTELGEPDWELVSRLADARLVVTDRDAGGVETAEVVHEALIRSWGRLRGWMEANRAFRTWQERLRFSLKQWEASGRDEGALLRGAPLAEAEGWLKERPEALGEGERAFVAAGVELRDHEAAEREAQRQRELEAAEALSVAERRRAEEQTKAARTLRRRAWALVVLVAVALGLGAAAMRLAHLASQSQRIASAREIAATARNHLTLDPERSLLLGLYAADRTKADGDRLLPEVTSVLHDSLHRLHGIRTLLGHEGEVFLGALSPDGTLLATGSQDKTVRLWDLTSGRMIADLRGHMGPAIHVTFSPDGRHLATGSASISERNAFVWDARSGTLVAKLDGHANGVGGIAFSPDGRLLATSQATDTIHLWDAATFNRSGSLTIPGATFGVVAFSPNSRLIAAARADKSVIVWTLDDPRSPIELGGLEGKARRISFSPDGSRLLADAHDKSTVVPVWDVKSGTLLHSLGGHRDVMTGGASWSPDGRKIVTASYDRTAKVWDAESWRELATLCCHSRGLSGVSWFHDGNRIVTTSFDGSVKLWDAATGRELGAYYGHSGSAYYPLVGPDDAFITTVGRDRTVRVWDVAPGHEVVTIPTGENLNAVAYSPDGLQLAASVDKHLRIWNAKSGRQLHDMGAPFEHQYTDIAYFGGGERIAAARDSGEIEVWSVKTEALERTLIGHTDYVERLVVSADGRWLGSAADDQSVRIWDAGTGELQRSLKLLGSYASSVDFDRQGLFLVTADSDGIRRWGQAEDRPEMEYQGHVGWVADVALSPDGKLMVSAGQDATVRMWDVKTSHPVRTLTGHTGLIFDVDFSPDGRTLATIGMDDGTARLWQAATGELMATIPSIDGQAEMGSIAFSPDGRHILMPNSATSMGVYLVNPDELIALARTRLTRTLTTDECRQYLHVEVCPTEE